MFRSEERTECYQFKYLVFELKIMKEQINQMNQPQDSKTSKKLTNKGRSTHLISKKQKQVKKKKAFTRKTKTITKAESPLTTKLKQISQQVTPSSSTTSITLCSTLSISIQNFMCTLLPLQQENKTNLAQINQYLTSIGEYYLERQNRFPLPPLNYTINFRPNQRLRPIQLISLQCCKMKLSLQTEFLAFDIFHRICTSQAFERYHSSLKAASALYVAAKYHELSAPQSFEFSNIEASQKISPQNIVKLQALIMMHLDFNLSYPVPLNFAQLLSIRFQLNSNAQNSLILLCRKAIYRQDLWLGKASLLAMACFCCLFGRVKEWQEVDSLRRQLDWRIYILQQMLDK